MCEGMGEVSEVWVGTTSSVCSGDTGFGGEAVVCHLRSLELVNNSELGSGSMLVGNSAFRLGSICSAGKHFFDAHVTDSVRWYPDPSPSYPPISHPTQPQSQELDLPAKQDHFPHPIHTSGARRKESEPGCCISTHSFGKLHRGIEIN